MPAAIYGSQLEARQPRAPSRSRSASRCASTSIPRNSKGYAAATQEIQAEIRRLWEWLVRMHELGRPRARRRRGARRPGEECVDRPSRRSSARSRSSASPTSASRRFVNRLTATREAVVFETPGVTRDRKEVVCEWAGKRFLLVDTGGVDVADASPLTQQVAEQARRAVEEADLVLFVVDAKAGVTPGDEEIADILRRAGKPGARRREQGRRPGRDDERARVPPARPRRPDADLGAARPRHRRPARPDRRRCSPADGPRRGGRGGDPRRHPRPAERRQVEPPERARRPGARDRLGPARGRRATRSTPCSSAAARRSSSSTRRGFAASAASGRGSSTTPSSARIEAAERADVALVLVDSTRGSRRPGSRRRGRRPHGRLTRRSSSSRSGTLRTVGIEDVRPRIESRLRQRPPIVAVSAKTDRGVGRLLDRVEELFARHTARVPTGELNRFLQELREERPGPEQERPAPQPPLRHAGLDAAAALPHLRQRPRPPHARLRLLGREPAAGAASASRACR